MRETCFVRFHYALVQCLDSVLIKEEQCMRDRLVLDNRGCMYKYTLNEIVQGRLREYKKTNGFFSDIQKAM